MGLLTDEELFLSPGEVSQRVLVVGGGIAGIQAALDVASLGHDVVLVEREPCLGGRMAQLSAMYPDLEHPVCLLRERMVEVWEHPRVTVLTNAEIERLDGFAGAFEAGIRVKARRVQEPTCTGCGKCWRECPVKVDSEFDLGIGQRPAIYLPYSQAIPSVPVIDEHNCLHFKGQACSACAQVCPSGSVDFGQPDSEFSGVFGAVVLATGLALFDPRDCTQYGYGQHPDVITSLHLERMLASAGPTKGEVFRPSDRSRPQAFAFVCCVGSRDSRNGRPYCSKVCCPNTAKQIVLLHRLYGDAQFYVFCTDIRTGGKGVEELMLRAQEECGARYVRGRLAGVVPSEKRLLVGFERAETPENADVEADLVVLAVGLEARSDTVALAGNLGVMCDENGFVVEAQRQLRPVETCGLGVFVAGSASGPKDIGETVAQGAAVAIRVAQFLRKLASKGVTWEELSGPNADWG